MNNLSPGTRLGPYEIVAPAGAGGMGEVWRARDTRLDRSVAIKLLPPEFATDVQLRLRFEREAKSISQFSHPNICTLYDVGQHDGVEYLVMEYIDGESLADRLARGRMPLEEVIRYGMEIAGALDRAHKAGIVHRDLKPGNVMLSKSGAKLVDFGLARESAGLNSVRELTALHTEKRPITAEGSIVGTFQYMAPEQLEGREIDARADIFALGVLLYEMATGRRAFQGNSRASLIASILATEPAPISTLQPLAPAPLERIIRTCLEKDPDCRFQSAHDVKLELGWLADSRDTEAVPARRNGRRELVAWSVAAILAAGLAIAALQLVKVRNRALSARPVRTSILPPDKTTFAFTGGPAAPPEISPDGKRVVFGTARNDGNRTLWIRSLDQPVPQQLNGTEGAYFPFWSADSRFVAFFAEGKLKKVEASGGVPVVICDVEDGRGGAWNRDGDILIGGRSSALLRVSSAGGTPTAATTLDPSGEITHRWPRFLPDGRHFFYVSSPSGGDDARAAVWVGSLDDRKLKKRVALGSSQAFFLDDHILFVRDGILVAQKYDLGKLEPVGDALALSEQQINGDVNFARRVFSLSDDGTLLFQAGDNAGDSQLLALDRAGKPIKTLGDPQRYGAVRISPDGSSVVTVVRAPAGGNLWLIDARGIKTRLTFGRDSNPVWAPEGKRIAYGCERSRPLDICVHDLTTGSDQPLVVTDTDKTPTSWGLGGRLLFYNEQSRGATASDIWYFDFVDRKAHPYLRTPFAENSAQLSPDGKWVAYQSNESGRAEIYLAPFPWTGAKWQVSNNGGVGPRWRADGREILYVTQGTGRSVIAVPVVTAATPEFGQPATLFGLSPPGQGVPYDISHDGHTFVVNSRIGDAPPPPPLSLVQNFRNELRATEAKNE